MIDLRVCRRFRFDALELQSLAGPIPAEDYVRRCCSLTTMDLASHFAVANRTK